MTQQLERFIQKITIDENGVFNMTTQQFTEAIPNASSPAIDESVIVEKHKQPASDPHANTCSIVKSGAGTLSLERCQEIFRRTRRCDCIHTEKIEPYGCNVVLVTCMVCRKIKEKIYQ